MTNFIRNNKGSAIILALAFLALFTTLTILSINTVVSGFKLMKRSTASVSAFYLAESGVQKALYELRKDYTWAGEGPVFIDWAGQPKGQYETSVAVIEGDKRRVVATGYFPQKSGTHVKRAVEVDIKPATPPFFFDNAIFSGEDVNLNGSYTVIGSIVYGDSIDPGNTPSSQQYDSDFPLLNFEQVRNIAISQIKENGQNNLYTQIDMDNGKPFPASFWLDEENGIPNVVYVETNLVLGGNIGTIGGFFVVAGDVITNPGAESDTTINGNGTVDGAIYTLGEFRINGGGNGLGVIGGVWAKDDVVLNGNAQVTYNQAYMNVIRNLNIAFKPQIISWKEKY